MTVELEPPQDKACKLEAALKAQLGNRVKNLRVMIEGDQLVLQGQTDTYYAKALAQETVMTISNLLVKANEIVVSR